MKELQKKYWLINLWWYIFVKRVLQLIALGWSHTALVSYPLAIDMAFGQMKYEYFKYGFFHIVNKVWCYNEVLVSRMEGKESKEDLSLAYLTEKEKLNRELSEEAEEVDRIVNDW
jgi:hypothetical protein